VDLFGRITPTGGVLFRRITGLKMNRYTLRNTTLGAAREFYLRACAVETAHLIIFILMNITIIISCILGKTQLVIFGTVANLIVNVYPILLQRYSRLRIFRLLVKKRNRS
jgi:hypothetical protein